MASSPQPSAEEAGSLPGTHGHHGPFAASPTNIHTEVSYNHRGSWHLKQSQATRGQGPWVFSYQRALTMTSMWVPNSRGEVTPDLRDVRL